jgi:hypothetical protein
LEGYLATLAYQLETAARHLPVLPSPLHPTSSPSSIAGHFSPAFETFILDRYTLFLIVLDADTVYKVRRSI